MLNKLKIEHGLREVTSMTQMFKDISLSKEVKEDFSKSASGRGITFELGIEVLSSSIWPSLDTIECKIPPPMRSAVENFELYYKNKQSNRKLDWLYSHGSVEVNTTYCAKKYQLITNVAQASILFLFNNNGGAEMTCKAI